MEVAVEPQAEPVRSADPWTGPEPSDVLGRAASGDPDALGEVVDGAAPEVRRYLSGLGLPLGADELEDALQETFLRLFRALPRVEPGRRLVPYALGIARHVALDLCRGRRHGAEAELDGVAGGASTSDRVQRLERGELVQDALAALDPELRSVLVLRVVNELPMKDLQHALGCSAPTARARVREAIHRFAIELRRRGLTPEEVCQ